MSNFELIQDFGNETWEEEVLLTDTIDYQLLGDKKDGQVRVRQKAMRVDAINGNNRLYPRHVVEVAVEEARPMARAGAMLSELLHPKVASIDGEDFYVDNHSAKTARVDDILPPDKDGWVYIDRTILNTPKGQTVADRISKNQPLGISTRFKMRGHYGEANGQRVHIADDMQICTWDDVPNPAFADAGRDFVLLSDSMREDLGLTEEVIKEIKSFSDSSDDNVWKTVIHNGKQIRIPPKMQRSAVDDKGKDKPKDSDVSEKGKGSQEPKPLSSSSVSSTVSRPVVYEKINHDGEDLSVPTSGPVQKVGWSIIVAGKKGPSVVHQTKEMSENPLEDGTPDVEVNHHPDAKSALEHLSMLASKGIYHINPDHHKPKDKKEDVKEDMKESSESLDKDEAKGDSGIELSTDEAFKTHIPEIKGDEFYKVHFLIRDQKNRDLSWLESSRSFKDRSSARTFAVDHIEKEKTNKFLVPVQHRISQHFESCPTSWINVNDQVVEVPVSGPVPNAGWCKIDFNKNAPTNQYRVHFQTKSMTGKGVVSKAEVDSLEKAHDLVRSLGSIGIYYIPSGFKSALDNKTEDNNIYHVSFLLSHTKESKQVWQPSSRVFSNKNEAETFALKHIADSKENAKDTDEGYIPQAFKINPLIA